MLGLLLTAGCLLALGACNQHDLALAANHLVTDADLPTTMDARVGETIELALASNPSTGYSWRCSWTPEAGLTKTGETYVGSGSKAPGSGGTTHFTFQCAQAGTVVITVQYGRWWEGGDRQDPQTVTVNITP